MVILLFALVACSSAQDLLVELSGELDFRSEPLPTSYALDVAEKEFLKQSVTMKLKSTSGPTKQIKDAFMDMLLGILLVVVAFPCLYFNEQRQVHMDKIFSFSTRHMVDVSADKVDEANHACPVCVQGHTATSEVLRDSELGVEVAGAAKLSRKVEMYQWVEHSHTEERDTRNGGKESTTTYSYSQEWTGSSQDSSCFHEGGHENPPMPLSSQDFVAKDVSLGSFKLDASLIGQMANFEPTHIGDQKVGGRPLERAGEGVIQSPGGPRIGDLRVSMSKVSCGAATVASIQVQDSFQPLTYALVPAGKCFCGAPPRQVDLSIAQLNPAGGDVTIRGGACGMLCSCVGAVISAGECVHTLRERHVSGKQLIAEMRSSQKLIHKVLMILALVMFVVGFYFIFKFPPSFFRYIPFIGVWVEKFGKFLAAIAGFFLGLAFWLITLAISWMVVKPLRGILLLCISAALIVVPTYVFGN